MQENWKQAWSVEGRRRAFILENAPFVTAHGSRKYLWGNVPAFDILNVQHNEVEMPKNLHLLFAGSSSMGG